MANSIAYAEIWEPILDEQLVADMASGFLEVDPKNIQITGADTFKVQKLSTSGLSEYDRSSGYVTGAMNLEWETLTLDQDRGKRFNIDVADADEANFQDMAVKGMAYFQKTRVAPEMDAYRFSKIFELSNQALKTAAYTPLVSTAWSDVLNSIKNIRKVIGESVPLRIAASYEFMAILESSTEIDRQLEIGTFSNGVINTKVKYIDDVPIFRVPDSRFNTEITLLNTEDGGFSIPATSMAINYMILGDGVAVARSKTSGVKVVLPADNQTYDGWSTYFRKRHGLWILDNSFDAVYVSYTPIAAVAPTVTFAAGSASGTTKATVTKVATANTLAYKVSTGQTTGILNNQIVPSGTTVYTSGADVAVTAGQYLDIYELDATSHVVRFVSHLTVSGEIKA